MSGLVSTVLLGIGSYLQIKKNIKGVDIGGLLDRFYHIGHYKLSQGVSGGSQPQGIGLSWGCSSLGAAGRHWEASAQERVITMHFPDAPW